VTRVLQQPLTRENTHAVQDLSCGRSGGDALPRDPSQQQRRLAALSTKFSAAQLGAAARAYFENLFSAAGDGQQASKTRVEVYGAMSDPGFSPAQAAVDALERRVGDADPGGARSSPAQMEEEEADDMQEEFAAAVKKVTEDARNAFNEHLRTIISSQKVWGREIMAVKLALSSPDMDAAAVIDFIASLRGMTDAAASGHKTIAERLEAMIPGGGLALAMGPPVPSPGDRSRTEAIIDRINKRNGFGGSKENSDGVGDANGAEKPRYRVAAPSSALPPSVGDTKARF
jgi:hypothetical protein